jgi:hypothetical protein
MNVKHLLSTIVVFGAVALSSLPASARDAVLTANFADSTINLRAIPNTNAQVRGYGIPGDRVRILDQRTGSNRNQWYYVQFYQTGTRGWVDGTYVQPLSIGGPSYGDGMIIDENRRFLVNSYEVKIYPAGGQTRMNVFNRRTNRTQLRGEAVSVNRNSDGVAYTGRNVEFFIHTNGKRTLTFF